MITCSETGSEIAAGQPVFALGRRIDPKRFAISAARVRTIPKKVRQDRVESYQTGGVNFYAASIVGSNGDSELEVGNFMFSLPRNEFRKRFPKAQKRFNFPRTATEDRIIQTE